MRLHYSQYALESYKALLALEASLTLDSTLKDLVKLRVSQINGCVFCVDMHVKEAKLHGERELRLHHLAVWHESTLFTEKERAALQWAENLTRISEQGVRDADYAAVRAHFDEEELVALTHVINTINVWNRLNVAFATPAGSMRPLQKSLSPDSRNPNTGFRLFPPLIAPDFTQMPP